jgi:PAS domain S-box-containing protein
LQTGIIFTHFFYVPIVLSAIWWKRNGILVALFLAILLLVSDFIYPLKGDYLFEDLIRMAIFVSVSLIVVILSEQIDKSRQKLHASEEKYRSVVKSAAEVIITVDSQGKIVSWNKEAEKMFGYEESEIMDQNVTLLMPRRFVDNFNSQFIAFENSSRTKFKMPDSLKGLRKDGSEFPFSASGSTWTSSEQTFYTTVIKDLTEQEKAEKVSATLSAIVENTTDSIIGQDMDGIILSWNMGAEKVYGYKAEDMIGKSISKLFVPGSDELEQILKITTSGEYIRNYETRRIRSDGKEIIISLTSSPIKDHKGQIIGVSSISRDITNQKRAENALKESEAQLRLLTNNMADVICRANKDSKYIYVSPSVRQVYGFKPSDLLGKSMFEFIHPDDISSVMYCMESSMEKCKSQNVEYRFQTAGGKYKWVETSGTPIFNEKNEIDGFVCTSRDIDDRKKAEEALIESEEKYRSLIEGANDPISLIDLSGNYIMSNTAGAVAMGLNPEEMGGKNVRDLFPKNADKMLEVIHQVVTTGQGVDVDMPLDDTGILIWYSTSIQPLKRADGTIRGVQVIARDITHIKDTEQKLKKALDDKEMLMKEIYHRVKNNLMVISSLLNLQSRYIKDQEAKGLFMESQDRARSMALIHERLYQSTDLKHIDFGDYLHNMARDLFNTYAGASGNVELDMEIDEVMLDINTSIPLGLIVNEIISNSLKHAFPHNMKGKISIKLYKDENEYNLKIKDNGIGIPEDVDLERTDSLGMQLINNLTEQINADLCIRRSPGTCFRIKFEEEEI